MTLRPVPLLGGQRERSVADSVLELHALTNGAPFVIPAAASDVAVSVGRCVTCRSVALENDSCGRCGATRQRSAWMVEDELREFVRGIGLTGFEPVHGDVELGGELAQRLDARRACRSLPVG
jgi:hypothetical protein